MGPITDQLMYADIYDYEKIQVSKWWKNFVQAGSECNDVCIPFYDYRLNFSVATIVSSASDYALC